MEPTTLKHTSNNCRHRSRRAQRMTSVRIVISPIEFFELAIPPSLQVDNGGSVLEIVSGLLTKAVEAEKERRRHPPRDVAVQDSELTLGELR